LDPYATFATRAPRQKISDEAGAFRWPSYCPLMMGSLDRHSKEKADGDDFDVLRTTAAG
jgi:hypothetical protein